MAEGRGGKILSITKKRAKRVQEKMMQKLGKSDQTRDGVFNEFVTNFNKQQNAATKLHKEMMRYMNSLRVLHQSTRSLCDTLGDLYDPEWEGVSKYKDTMEQRLLLWEDLLTTLTSKMVEPMSNYISRFPEVKNRIAKRERKVVDYDLTRRELESLRAKAKVNDQKIQQAEEAYTHAKQLYDEITDELYEELPTFYDSRVQFYASVFQSIAATESKFHAEMTKVDEQCSELMDALAAEAATGAYSTKKERNVDTAPKLLSRPGEDSEEDSEGEAHPPVGTSPETANEDGVNTVESSASTPSSTTPNSTPILTPSSADKKPPQLVPFSSSSLKRQPPTKPTRSPGSLERNTAPDFETQPPSSADDVQEGTQEANSTRGSQSEEIADMKSPKTKTPPPKPVPFRIPSPPPTLKEGGEKENEENEGGEKDKEEGVDREMGKDEASKTNGTAEQGEDSKVPEGETAEVISSPKEDARKKSVPEVLYKVVATHPYEGEDEDELTFEKGVVINVIPYDDPEDEEEGWSMGFIEESGARGIFPNNFTKNMQ